jgi:hypothetical protein
MGRHPLSSSVEQPTPRVVFRCLRVALVADEPTRHQRIHKLFGFEVGAAKFVRDRIAQRRPAVEVSGGPGTRKTRAEGAHELGQIDVFHGQTHGAILGTARGLGKEHPRSLRKASDEKLSRPW